MLRIFKNNFFCRTHPVAALMCTRKRRRGKLGTKGRGKKIENKEEDEHLTLKFYLQVFMLVVTEMQIQLYKH